MHPMFRLHGIKAGCPKGHAVRDPDMDTTFLLLVTILLVFLTGFVFSMFGQGGGSAYSPILILLGYAVLLSTSTSLVLNLITSVSAGYIFYRNKMIDFRTSLAFVPGICVGAFIGGALGNFVDTRILLWLFVFFLVGCGSQVYLHLLGKRASRERSASNRLLRRHVHAHLVRQFRGGIYFRPAGGWRRHTHRSFHGLRLQVSSEVGGWIVAFDYILLSTFRNNRSFGIWQSRSSIDCGDWCGRSHRRKSRGENQHEVQIRSDKGRAGSHNVGACCPAPSEAPMIYWRGT